MSIEKTLNFAKLAASYVSENDPEKAMASAMLMLDHIEKSGVTTSDFDSIDIKEVVDILPIEESSANNFLNTIKKALN